VGTAPEGAVATRALALLGDQAPVVMVMDWLWPRAGAAVVRTRATTASWSVFISVFLRLVTSLARNCTPCASPDAKRLRDFGPWASSTETGAVTL
jgi:hypothetical protein